MQCCFFYAHMGAQQTLPSQPNLLKQIPADSANKYKEIKLSWTSNNLMSTEMARPCLANAFATFIIGFSKYMRKRYREPDPSKIHNL